MLDSATYATIEPNSLTCAQNITELFEFPPLSLPRDEEQTNLILTKPDPKNNPLQSADRTSPLSIPCAPRKRCRFAGNGFRSFRNRIPPRTYCYIVLAKVPTETDCCPPCLWFQCLHSTGQQDGGCRYAPHFHSSDMFVIPFQTIYTHTRSVFKAETHYFVNAIRSKSCRAPLVNDTGN